jgi:hypothetical protein
LAEIREAGVEPVKVASASLDLNEIISKVRNFVDGIKEMTLGEKPMAVSVEGLDFSVGKAEGKYDLSLSLSLAFKPKAFSSVAAEPF